MAAIDFGMTVGEVVGKGRGLKDRFGIEFELEGEGLPKSVAGWDVTHDGSLRNNGLEYVTSTPYTLEDALSAIAAMEKATAKSKIANTGYAGTHIHVNVSDLSITKMFNFALLFLALEDIIASRYYGEGRKGNLFCLCASDAEGLINYIYRAVIKGDLTILKTDDIRYSSLNFSSLFKHGTLEFRGQDGIGDFNRARDWLRFLAAFKTRSTQFDDPVAMLMVSSRTDGRFAEEFLGELTDEELSRVRAGVRRIQPIVFEGEW
jgi:hypothetical protein